MKRTNGIFIVVTLMLSAVFAVAATDLAGLREEYEKEVTKTDNAYRDSMMVLSGEYVKWLNDLEQKKRNAE